MKPLSPREQELIELLVQGCTRKEAAQKLGISVRTANNYLTNVQRKACKPTLLSAITFVVANGMVMVNSA
jgi:DNA-binding NarL/FixJ family response regulator